MRHSGRNREELRPVTIQPHVSLHAEGSCLIMFGNTHVLCCASVDESVPAFLRGKGSGWITAEYSMLPRATHRRMKRDINLGKISGRTQEIQRLIARALRAAVDLEMLGERQIIIDCDVLQADGGTRTAAITGGFVALSLAIKRLLAEHKISKNPIMTEVAAVSCGIIDHKVLLDIDYEEDSEADVDANFIMTGHGSIVEVQAIGEESSFTKEQLDQMLVTAEKGIKELIKIQRSAISKS
ncbi:ribonuclease PH [Rickettsiales endosymbiont of Stachyamoeba lipophora]|uniref:ribonuclease PH n=1 Tax=Rickettsiales endosymbiont of Stachyamoeba lipophora TaxID=2486578 RepID=UPI000F651CFD|nr:ribonuclease PH [Rickettsiales endosymbiont of Stachyamoeba lipophora]AZL14987.1 ribonuclease PH [Rickettsiales endosymbiont of Stachyamoeba lipophora]